jgi:hypothetical protein
VALWLLTHCVSGISRDSVVGDLLEQYAAGRSRTWFWRQTFVTIVLSFATAAWSHRWMAFSVLLVDQMLAPLYMRLLSHWTAVVHSAWYPRTWNWLATSAPDPFLSVAVWLHPWAWTTEIVWCGILATVAQAFVMVRPSERRFIAAMFILLNVIRYLPYVVDGIASYDPASPAWAANFIWYTTYELVVIPLSILFGTGTLSLTQWMSIETSNG